MRLASLAIGSLGVLLSASALAQVTPAEPRTPERPGTPTTETPPPPPQQVAPAPPTSASAQPSAPAAPATPPPPSEPAPAPTPAPTPAPALAPAPLPTASWGTRGQRGVEVEVRFGVMVPNAGSPVRSSNLYPGNMIGGDPTGDILEGKESPYGPGVPSVAVTLGYRFLPWLSAGASFSYSNFWVNDGTDNGDYKDTTQGLERQYWSLAAYARYYLVGLHPRLEPWIELGVGYSDDNANYNRAATQTRMGSAETQQYLLEEQGVVTSLALGLDWRLATFLSVGPSLGWAQTFSTKACVTDNVDSMSLVAQITNRCVNQDDPVTQTPRLGAVSGTNYGVFFGGVYAKLTFLGP